MFLLKRFTPYKSYLTIAIVLAILLLALFLRSSIYIHNDFNFFLDQSRDLMLVKEIVVEHKLPLIGARSGIGGIFHGPLWLYMITPFFILANGDPFLTLVPLFLIISLSIVTGAFFIGQKLYGTPTGLLFAFILAMSTNYINASLVTTNAQVMPLIFLIYIFSIINVIRGKDVYLILSALTIGIGMHFESAFSAFLIPLTVVALVVRRSRPTLKHGLISIGVLFLTVSNFLFFEIRHSFLMTNSVLKLFQGKVEEIQWYERYGDLGFRVQDRAALFLQQFTEPLFQPNTISSLIVGCLLLATVAILLFRKKKGKTHIQCNKEFFLILLIPFLYYSVYVLYPMPLWGHYTLPLTITSALLLALALKHVSSFIVGRVFVVVFLVLITVPTLVWLKQTYIPLKTYAPTIDGSYINQLAAATKVFTDAGETKFGYFQYASGSLTYNMDYLMWWLGKKHGYTPPNQKRPTTYLIMYPVATDNAGGQEFWKKNVVRTQVKASARWTMPGGINIEKLKIPQNDPDPDPNYYTNLLFR